MALIDLQSAKTIKPQVNSSQCGRYSKYTAEGTSVSTLLASAGALGAHYLLDVNLPFSNMIPAATAIISGVGSIFTALDRIATKDNDDVQKILRYLNGTDPKMNERKGYTPDRVNTYTFNELEKIIDEINHYQCNPLSNKDNMFAKNKRDKQHLLADALLALPVANNDAEAYNQDDLDENARVLSKLLNTIELTPEFLNNNWVQSPNNTDVSMSLNQAINNALPGIREHMDEEGQNKIDRIMDNVFRNFESTPDTKTVSRCSSNPFAICFRSSQSGGKPEHKAPLIETTDQATLGAS